MGSTRGGKGEEQKLRTLIKPPANMVANGIPLSQKGKLFEQHSSALEVEAHNNHHWQWSIMANYHLNGTIAVE